jgi:glycosyltransferase involved in cell wall biosynthesis
MHLPQRRYSGHPHGEPDAAVFAPGFVARSAADRQPSRILYISAGSPVPAKIGPARRNYHVLTQLRRFFDVSLLALGTRAQARLFAEIFGDGFPATFVEPQAHGTRWKYAQKVWRTATGRCDFLPVIEPDLRRACRARATARDFDLIVLSSVFLRRLPLPTTTPIVGDTHNVEFDVHRRTTQSADSALRRVYARWQWPATLREEILCCRRVDLLLSTSDRDRHVFEDELRLANVEVVSNGIDLREFAPLDPSTGRPTLLFTGLMSYYPNQQAIRWFLEAIWPAIFRAVPAARLVIAGADPPAWLRVRAGDAVAVTGAVTDMRPYLKDATIVVAPLLIGGGTRVKILEALAVGRPVVSTSLGAEGLGLRHQHSVLLADDAAAFAEQVVRLLEDPALRAGIAAAGRAHVVDHFDWDRIGERLRDLLHVRHGLQPRTTPLSPSWGPC